MKLLIQKLQRVNYKYSIASVVAANDEMQQFSTRWLMSHLLATLELVRMFPNLSKLHVASIGLVLPMSIVDCERGAWSFSSLMRQN